MEKAWGFHLTPVRIAKVKKTTDSKASKVAEKGEGSHSPWVGLQNR